MKVIKVRVIDEEMDPKAAEKMPFVKKAIASAKSVLSIFEKEYLGDKRPRKAIEAAEAWVKNPTEKNRVLADKAASVLSASAVPAAAAASFAAYAASRVSSRATAAVARLAAYASSRATADN